MAANNFVFDLYLNEFKKRKIFVISHNLLVSFFWIFQNVFVFLNNEKILLTTGLFYKKYPLGTYSYKDLNLLPRIINFSEYHKKKQNELITQITGDRKEYKIACIHLRDEKYLRTLHPNFNWSYHNFRDCTFSNYIPAINYLIHLNYYVILLGNMNVLNQDLIKINNKKLFINYHLSKFKNECNDIFLINSADLIIGTHSGMSMFAQVLNQPTLFVNVTPFVEKPMGKKNFFIHKKVLSKKTNKFISLREGLKKKLNIHYRNNTIEELGYQYIENNEKEILDAVKEMLNYKKNNYKFDPTDFQKTYNNIFLIENSVVDNKNYVCNSFLIDNKYLLDD